ncbi:MAG TPA: phosphatase PAP2 family protein [Firmicutes bacterium]|nr:phosphatase PAP2 family protein [Bacillota bacterium]
MTYMEILPVIPASSDTSRTRKVCRALIRNALPAALPAILLCSLFFISWTAPVSAGPVVTAEEALTGAAIFSLSLSYDQAISSSLQSWQNPVVLGSSRLLHNVGYSAGVALTLGGIYLADEETGIDAIKSVLLTQAAVNVGKVLLGRERPDTENSRGRFTGMSFDDAYHSMPSGHTATAFSLATVLAHHDPKRSWLYYGYATVMGLSRVVLARHWPSDVVAGAFIGIISARLVLDAGD